MKVIAPEGFDQAERRAIRRAVQCVVEWNTGNGGGNLFDRLIEMVRPAATGRGRSRCAVQKGLLPPDLCRGGFGVDSPVPCGVSTRLDIGDAYSNSVAILHDPCALISRKSA